jgi:hypothetical protein
MAGKLSILQRLQNPRKRRHTPAAKFTFAILIELFEIIGFVIGFVAVVQLPAKNMESDLTKIDENSWVNSVHAVKEELKILVDSSIQSRTLGFVAMVFIVIAFILRTIVSRIIRMPGDL